MPAAWVRFVYRCLLFATEHSASDLPIYFLHLARSMRVGHKAPNWTGPWLYKSFISDCPLLHIRYWQSMRTTLLWWFVTRTATYSQIVIFFNKWRIKINPTKSLAIISHAIAISDPHFSMTAFLSALDGRLNTQVFSCTALSLGESNRV